MPKKYMEELNAIPAEVAAEIKRLQEEIAGQERAGQFNTVHHEALRNIQAAIAQAPEPTAPPYPQETGE